MDVCFVTNPVRTGAQETNRLFLLMMFVGRLLGIMKNMPTRTISIKTRVVVTHRHIWKKGVVNKAESARTKPIQL